MSLIRSLRQKALYDAADTVEVDPATYRTNNAEWYFGNAGVDYHFSYNGHNSSLNAYRLCGPLTAIINKQAQAHINGKTWVLNKSGKAKGKESTSEFAQKVRRLMAQPNPLQTWKEFEAQQKIYMKVFGWCFCLPIYPVGWDKYGLSEATSMWNIPPYMVDITETNKLFYQTDLGGILSKVVLNYRGVRSELQIKDLILFKDFIPSMESLVFPETRILSLRMPINNIIGAYESRNQLINYAGAQGLFSPGSDVNGPIPLKEDAKLQLQKDFMRYGIRKDQWKYIFSPTTLTWQQVGRPTKDLMLFEEIVDDIMRLCDGFNHPYRLMAHEANSLGGADLKVHTSNLYQDAIIPDAESIYEVWNRAFKADENNCIIEKDFNHIDALQEDKLFNAKAQREQNESCKTMFFNNLITYNRWLEMVGEDTINSLDIDGKSVDAGSMYYYQLDALGMKFGNMAPTPQTVDNGAGKETGTAA